MPRSRSTFTFVTPVVVDPSNTRRSQVVQPEVEHTSTNLSEQTTTSAASSAQPPFAVPTEQPTTATEGRQFPFERELSRTPFSFTRGESSFEREVSSTPFSVADTPQVSHEILSNEFTDNEASGSTNVRLTWTEDINWTFLQIMLWIYDDMSMATDNYVRSRIWANARELLIEELRTHVPGTELFCSHVTTEKMQDAWDRMKRTYKAYYNEANLQTGVGGRDPATRWVYYVEMAIILRNDVSVHPDIVIENYNHLGEAGAFITDNRIRNREDEENIEIMAERRARARNVHFLPKQVVKERVIDRAQRYAEEYVEEQANNHAIASGIQLTGTAESSNTTTNNNNASTNTTNNNNNNNATASNPQTYADNISGAGRTTRRNTAPTQNRRRSSQRQQQQQNLPTTVDHEQFLSRIEGTASNLIEAFHENRTRRREENLEMMNHMLSELARERRLYLREMFNQMWAMRQGQRPNPFAGDNERADERAASIPSTLPSHPIPTSPIPSSANPPSPINDDITNTN